MILHFAFRTPFGAIWKPFWATFGAPNGSQTGSGGGSKMMSNRMPQKLPKSATALVADGVSQVRSERFSVG